MATPKQSSPSRNDIRKQQKLLMRNKIVEFLSRFKFSDLLCDVILKLFELEKTDMNYKLNELKLEFNKKSVVELLSHRTKAFRLEELENLYQLLQLYCTSFYSKRKIWTPLNLLEQEDDFRVETDLQMIRRNILQSFRIKGLNAVVEAVLHEDMIWLIIIEKKLTKKKGIKLQTPIFVTYEPGTPYIFVASTIPEKIMQCILRAMHYKKFKTLQLEGKIVKSLLSILKNKAVNGNNAKLVEYRPDSFKIGHRNYDFTKVKAREVYADEIFNTKEPISLETFTVNAEAVWRENDVLPELNGQMLHTKLQLSSVNLIDMFKYMIVNEMVPNPLPEYIKAILRSGRNKIDMRDPRIQPPAN